MNEFKFGNNTLTIKFGDEIFDVDPAVCQVGVAQAQKVLNTFNTSLQCGEVKNEDIENAISNMIGYIENVLGAGAVGKILKVWKKNAIRMHDVCDIMIYMRASAEEFEKQKGREYLSYSPYPHNQKPHHKKK